ncbi:DUF732 domain-containing protein [Rhodococcus artemisiae]|uniref:DUF732 domain-containing protein n=1 Tax=Rhodococcus artemisiae TaxID=714159 RepID=A0ABU7LBM1_9NOCA|nr:DUF732 domain-containing protein [Rhodococcus artemisiae]MEE2058937.1 DUF732 domain-containing protein [Rhodococcus artemisiae]
MTPTKFTIARYYLKDLTRMNKRRATVVVSSLFAGALVAAACTATGSEVEGTALAASAPASAPASPVAATHTPPTATAADKDALFIAVLDERRFPYGGAEDLALEVGYAACDALDSGVSMVQLAAVTLEKYSPEDGGTFLGAAVGALCDEHIPKVEAFQAQFGGN